MPVKRKKFLTALCLVISLMAFSGAPVKAVGGDASSRHTEIVPMMEYIYDAEYDFVISKGKAIMYAVVSGHAAKATKCRVTVELQEKGGAFWSTVETWTATEYGRRAELDISKKVTVGKIYRMVTIVTVWKGNDSETKTMISDPLKA